MAKSEALFEIFVDQPGFNVDVRDNMGRTPLHLATQVAEGTTNDIPLVKLLALGATVDCVDGNGETPLFGAARATKVEAMKRLLDAKANVNHANASQQTPLHIASVQSKSLEAIKVLIEYGAEPDQV
eukprot:NODE_1874_length_1581_cov_29.117970_g1784_i0.p1 GENE.NODE_1874_length_1581_cov_29.117970_g1784_i0~~NODE_1874_length_1581_cov_29.117970_g1784_i0.p1  ORF type:complete len:127 (+),score=21.70 NODE_1874_length_1581_cov_29.117970_g1784_i0:181-561(+)